jgi:hypothetical protein
MRDTGMRNKRELYRMRIENLDWESRVIFVPDSKTEEGWRRADEQSCFRLSQGTMWCKARRLGFPRPNAPSLLTSPQWRRDFAKPESRLGYPKILPTIVDDMTTAPGF